MNQGAVTPSNQSYGLFGVFVAKVFQDPLHETDMERLRCNNQYDFIVKILCQQEIEARDQKNWYNNVITELLEYFRFVSRCYNN